MTSFFKIVFAKFLKERVSNMPNEVKFVEFDGLRKFNQIQLVKLCSLLISNFISTAFNIYFKILMHIYCTI